MRQKIIFDTHTHLADALYDTDRAEAVKRACESGVKLIVEICDGCESLKKAYDFVSNYGHIYLAFGFHPHSAGAFLKEGQASIFEDALNGGYRDKIKAVGEVGLDYFKDYVPREEQRNAFIRQLEIWRRTDLALILHSRDAQADTIKILNDYVPKGRGKAGIVHCFSGGYESACGYIELGFLLGVGGTITFPKNTELKNTIKRAGLNNIVLETDCPYLAPAPLRGRRNEPAFLTHIVSELEQIFGLSGSEIIGRTTTNAANLFNIEV